ncbi:DOG1 domain-containing protein [Artemisia annua]|uniref:DOG1 domain-containing protein n=1 Tax=Artemisia annua TaxID=35608 RepID=A0A2U1QKY9_ARTAN|nr:DOG1 domain-containing protein [Artemisia annua]
MELILSSPSSISCKQSSSSSKQLRPVFSPSFINRSKPIFSTAVADLRLGYCTRVLRIMTRKSTSCGICENTNLASVCTVCVNHRLNLYGTNLTSLKSRRDALYLKLSHVLVAKSKADDQLSWKVLQHEKLAALREKLHFRKEQLSKDKAKVQEMGADLKVRFESLESSMDVLERTRKEQLEKYYPNLICTQSLGHQKLYDKQMAITSDRLHKQSIVIKQICKLFPQRKAYVQQLELGRLKLAKLEHEIEKTRQQDAYMDLSNRVHGLLLGNINSGVVAFEKKYDFWVVEQRKIESQLLSILQSDVIDDELRVFVDGVVNHYDELFRMKADAAKVDAFNLLYGSWKSPVERLFQWLGGFRPSEILYILMPQFEPLTDAQIVNLSKLRHTCRQAEDALTQGIDKLHQTLAQSLAINMAEGGNYDTYMSATIEGLEALENFLNQADHLRHRTLQQMSRILTMRQAAKGLLALGEYFQRLRVLNSLWSARPHRFNS